MLLNCEGGCHTDIARGDNVVNAFDLLELLANWNTDRDGADIAPPADTVNTEDLLVLLDSWDMPCQDFNDPPETTYSYDDGEIDLLGGLAPESGSGDIVWLHRFEAAGGRDTIDSICTSFGAHSAALANGQIIEWGVYNDDGNNIDPLTSTALATGSATVEGQATLANRFQCIEIPQTTVEESFFVAVKVPNTVNAWPAPNDQSVQRDGIAWGGVELDSEQYGGNNFDINDLTTLDSLTQSSNFGGVWLLLAD